MELSRRGLDAYNAAIKRQGDGAEAASRAALAAWLADNPDATVAETRDFCVALLSGLGEAYGNGAGDAAYALRAAIAEAAGVELPDVDYRYAPDAAYVDAAARYQATKLAKGDTAGFVDGIADAARYFAERGANDTMANLGARDAKRLSKKVRFARVPTGPTNCDYCVMLASRGFVYRSELVALNANHRHCDCRIVEGFDGMAVQGYDPDEYYDMWKNPGIYEGLDAVTTASLACLRVAERRGQVAYEKPLLSFLETDDGKRDLVAHAALARSGRRFVALAEDAPEGFSNIDLMIDGQLWEIKSPPGSNPRAIESNLRKAKRQAEKAYPYPEDEVRVVFNGYFYGQDDGWASERLSQEADRHGISNVLHVGKDGNVRPIRKA